MFNFVCAPCSSLCKINKMVREKLSMGWSSKKIEFSFIQGKKKIGLGKKRDQQIFIIKKWGSNRDQYMWSGHSLMWPMTPDSAYLYTWPAVVVDTPTKQSQVNVLQQMKMWLYPNNAAMNSSLCVCSCATEADLNIAQTAWGDSGVYYCSVVSSQDLSGNSEAYTELIVLGKLVTFSLQHTRTLFFFFSRLPAISTHSYTRYSHKKWVR